MPATVYLIPCFLDEQGLDALPAYVLTAVKQCQVFFVENERTARRYLKSLWKEINIDSYQWYTIHKTEQNQVSQFRQELKKGNVIGIISEAGCPGIADPGQLLVAAAQDLNVRIVPLVGPSSILLALMASGLNGQQFRFCGYLPIDVHPRIQALHALENESRKLNCTQLFIETPYRNNQMLETILKNCKPDTELCIAVNLSGKEESIRTKSIAQWKKEVPDINKKPAIFLILAH